MGIEQECEKHSGFVKSGSFIKTFKAMTKLIAGMIYDGKQI